MPLLSTTYMIGMQLRWWDAERNRPDVTSAGWRIPYWASFTKICNHHESVLPGNDAFLAGIG